MEITAAEVRDEEDICGQEWFQTGAWVSFLSTNFHHGSLPRTEDCNNPLSDECCQGFEETLELNKFPALTAASAH